MLSYFLLHIIKKNTSNMRKNKATGKVKNATKTKQEFDEEMDKWREEMA